MAATKSLQLSRPTAIPASPGEAVLDRVRNPHPETSYVALHIPGIHLHVPGHRAAGFRDARHRLR
jgi:hypothetical protein